jgi:GH24 family phage-related lysozyme (muramidase)
MIEQLREELEADEGGGGGVIYLDHLGLKTCGVGHLCKEGDPEYEMEVGTPVSEERVAELFERDIGWTLSDCQKLLPDFDMLPEPVRLIVANMCYNLGINRLGRFLRLLEAIENRDWQLAATEMYDSKWRRQLPARSGRLIARMREVPADSTSDV